MKLKGTAGVAGFTLIEVLIICVIFGVVVAFAIPNLSDVVRNSSTKSSARDLYGWFHQAKTEAVKRNQSVSISLVTTDPQQFKVFVDSDGDRILDAGEEVLAEIQLAENDQFSGITFADSSAGFDARGRPLGGVTGQVDIENTNTGSKFRVETTVSGFVHIEKLP